MNHEFKLTIAVITMNRCDQLREALESCAMCALPEKTEYVIVDNGSTDDTTGVVARFSEKYSTHPVNYTFSEENLGVGGGRSRAFELAKGEIVYFLDDDAVIAEESRKTFFSDSVNYLDHNKNVASLTTKIYDEMLGSDREILFYEKMKIGGLPCIFKFLGGSHFLRKAYFPSPLYFNIKYGCEEYAPSITVQHQGYFHVFDEHITVIHKPKVNKWAKGGAETEYPLCCECAGRYATARLLYPNLFFPLLKAAYELRCAKYLRRFPGAKKRTNAMVKEIIKQNRCKKISIQTVFMLARKFGSAIF